jgi:hypothetical protein
MIEDDRARVQAVWDRLAQTMTAIVEQVESRIDERCPYKTRDALCTFQGGCQNQRRAADRQAVACGGDHLILWTRHDEP